MHRILYFLAIWSGILLVSCSGKISSKIQPDFPPDVLSKNGFRSILVYNTSYPDTNWTVTSMYDLNSSGLLIKHWRHNFDSADTLQLYSETEYDSKGRKIKTVVRELGSYEFQYADTGRNYTLLEYDKDNKLITKSIFEYSPLYKKVVRFDEMGKEFEKKQFALDAHGNPVSDEIRSDIHLRYGHNNRIEWMSYRDADSNLCMVRTWFCNDLPVLNIKANVSDKKLRATKYVYR